MEDDAHHLFFGRRAAGPDFELARTLLHKHFDTRDDRDACLASEAEQRSFERVVDEIEDEFSAEVFGCERRDGLVPGHADGGSR